MDLTEPSSLDLDPGWSSTRPASGLTRPTNPNIHNQHFHHPRSGGNSSSYQSSSSSSSALTTTGALNLDVLQLINITESKNFTCQAQNSFGLVVYNLTVVIKGKEIIFQLFLFIYCIVSLLLYRNKKPKINSLFLFPLSLSTLFS